jgi:CheY-like chemotaxis protein
VLVVDDDPDIREALTMLLEAEGFQAIAVANGREALDHIATHPHPCLIILDLMMPVMDGWQFLEAKRTCRRLDGVPVIVCSAVVNPTLDERLRDVQGIFRKGNDPHHLVALVRQFC